MDDWVTVLTAKLGDAVATSSHEVRFNCWRCSDTSHHLYVNPSKEKYFCQKCQTGGTLSYLAKILDLSLPEDTAASWSSSLRLLLVREDDPPCVCLDPDPLDWPDEYTPMFPGADAASYLHDRGISDEMISFYQIGIGTKKLRGRIIFPDIDDKCRLVYWVARDYVRANTKIKYMNAGVPRDNQVFNLGRIKLRGDLTQLVICEGPISAIVAGYDAVCTYGKYVTRTQLERLLQCKVDRYVIAGDGDAVGSSVQLAKRFSSRGAPVFIAEFSGDEDPASVGYEEARRRIDNALPWNSALELQLSMFM